MSYSFTITLGENVSRTITKAADGYTCHQVTTATSKPYEESGPYFDSGFRWRKVPFTHKWGWEKTEALWHVPLDSGAWVAEATKATLKMANGGSEFVASFYSSITHAPLAPGEILRSDAEMFTRWDAETEAAFHTTMGLFLAAPVVAAAPVSVMDTSA
jgi:hypothetical protein